MWVPASATPYCALCADTFQTLASTAMKSPGLTTAPAVFMPVFSNPYALLFHRFNRNRCTDLKVARGKKTNKQRMQVTFIKSSFILCRNHWHIPLATYTCPHVGLSCYNYYQWHPLCHFITSLTVSQTYIILGNECGMNENQNLSCKFCWLRAVIISVSNKYGITLTSIWVQLNQPYRQNMIQPNKLFAWH